MAKKTEVAPEGVVGVEPASSIVASPHVVTKVLEVRVDGDKLFIKVSPVVEDAVKRNCKDEKESSKWFGDPEAKGKFYRGFLNAMFNGESYFELDNVNAKVIERGLMNAAVLRVPGISEGQEFDLPLAPKGVVEKAVRDFAGSFKRFYNDFFTKTKIRCELTIADF